MRRKGGKSTRAARIRRPRRRGCPHKTSTHVQSSLLSVSSPAVAAELVRERPSLRPRPRHGGEDRVRGERRLGDLGRDAESDTAQRSRELRRRLQEGVELDCVELRQPRDGALRVHVPERSGSGSGVTEPRCRARGEGEQQPSVGRRSIYRVHIQLIAVPADFVQALEYIVIQFVVRPVICAARCVLMSNPACMDSMLADVAGVIRLGWQVLSATGATIPRVAKGVGGGQPGIW